MPFSWQNLPWILLLISVFTPAFAQPAVELETLVIETERVQAKPQQTLQNRELRLQIESTLGATLQRELGVNNLSYGPGVGQAIIRGFSGTRVRMMNNGMGLHDLSSLSPDLAVAFDPLLADSITVLKGPATLRYGGNALGGAVDIDHHRIPDHIPLNGYSGRSSFSYNSNSSDKSGMIALDAGEGLFAVHGDYYRHDADNTQIPGYALDEEAIEQQFQVTPENNSYGAIENSHSAGEGGSAGIAMLGE